VLTAFASAIQYVPRKAFVAPERYLLCGHTGLARSLLDSWWPFSPYCGVGDVDYALSRQQALSLLSNRFATKGLCKTPKPVHMFIFIVPITA
jgi:hypothetical protein